MKAITFVFAVVGVWVVGDWLLSLPARWTYGSAMVLFFSYVIVGMWREEKRDREIIRKLREGDKA